MSTETQGPARVLPFVPRGGLTFGIYHGGVVESHKELATGKPDLPDEVNRALDRLQGSKRLLVRTYLRFTGTEADVKLENMPGINDLARYTWNGRKLDLVLSNWDSTGNLPRWASFIQNVITRYGEYVGNLQICEEPNLFDYPGDGRYGHSVEAVVQGVQTARQALRGRGLKCSIGFNAVPTSVLNDSFWRGLRTKINHDFLNSLDYIGLNLYVDVGEPLIGPVGETVERSLREFREVNLQQAGIPAIVPLHISENGWPTGPNRFYTRQAEMLNNIVSKIYDLRTTLNINYFGLFSLRDADTGNPDPSRQFGIMRDDYSPKPAFDIYRQLIQDYGD